MATNARLRRENAFLNRNYGRYAPVTVELTIRNGFPLIAMGVLSKEDPSVGILNACMEDVQVVTKDWKSAEFLKLTPAERRTIEKVLLTTATTKHFDC